MPFHTLAYTLATGGAVTDSEMTAATDSEISQRNSHYIFTEDYKLLAAGFFGATATRLNIQVPTWNAVTRFNVWPPQRAVTVPSNPILDQWFRYPPPIPQNEEFTLKVSDTAAEQVTAFLCPGTGNWNQNLPQGKAPLPIFELRLNFTTAALTANTWSGLGAVTFEQSLRGGTYAVVGAEAQGAGILAGRFVFPRAPMYKNRKMRPGFLFSQALGDVPFILGGQAGAMVWGEYGRFSTFEPPQMEFWGNAGGAVAIEVRVWVVWLSDSMDVQY